VKIGKKIGFKTWNLWLCFLLCGYGRPFEEKVGREGVEPSRPCGQEILSLRRLPFRHRPLYKYHDSIMLWRFRQQFFSSLSNTSSFHLTSGLNNEKY
jgi:hypothetical protein